LPKTVANGVKRTNSDFCPARQWREWPEADIGCALRQWFWCRL